jgi:hypothetical protein
MPKHDEYQCGRCGSSIRFETCTHCWGYGYFEDDGGEDDVKCFHCDGEGTIPICISSPEWCESHPMPGQEATQRSSLGKFCIGGK